MARVKAWALPERDPEYEREMREWRHRMNEAEHIDRWNRKELYRKYNEVNGNE